MEIICRPLSNSSEDFLRIYKLKSLANDIYWSGYINPPDKINFANWFNIQLTRTDRKIWLSFDYCSPEKCLGYCYLTFESERNCKIGIISIGVDSRFKGNGIGSAMVNFLVNYTCGDYSSADVLRAWIVNDNYPSINCFLKNGFIKTSRTKELFYESFGKTVMLDCYEFKFQRS